jgi:glycine/D-amino acid oxidase-like deaminating enzyme
MQDFILSAAIHTICLFCSSAPGVAEMASGDRKRTVGVIGAGMVGVTAASFLLRKGHDVTLVDPGNPGEGTSFGNAGCFNGSSVVPMSMPGTIRNVPGWLTDPMGPLVVRWSYLPALAPWLVRFIRAGTKVKLQRASAFSALPDVRVIERCSRTLPNRIGDAPH